MGNTWNPVNNLSDIDLTVVAALEAAFNNDYSITQACHYAHISRQTYYNYLEIEEFAEKMDQAQQMPLRKSREVVIKAINEGDANLAFKFLQARDSAYKSKIEAVITTDEQALEDVIKDLTNDRDNLPDDSPRIETPPSDESTPSS